MSFENEYRELMEKPIEEIREDIFFRLDNFQHELWYGDFEIFLTVGLCQPRRNKPCKSQGPARWWVRTPTPSAGAAGPIFSPARPGKPRGSTEKAR